jgi:ubiquinone/menaquinone biosynthesis C-methylase UbiE
MDYVAKQKESFRQHYKKYANGYDKLRDDRSPITRANAENQIGFVLECFQNINEIVEVGCGTGKFTIPLAKEGKKVVAIDYAEEMLDIVHKKAVARGLEDRIELKHGDIENLDIPSGSAKGLLSIAVLRHFEREAKAVSELSRVLDNSGVLLIDYLSSFFFKPYDFLNKLLLKKAATKGHQWYRNYYRSAYSMKKILKDHELEIIKKKGFVLLPTSVTEKLHVRIPVEFIERRLGLGGVVFLVTRKII